MDPQARSRPGRGTPLHPGATHTTEPEGHRRAAAGAGSCAVHATAARGVPRNASAQTGFARGAIVCRAALSVCNAQQSGLI